MSGARHISLLGKCRQRLAILRQFLRVGLVRKAQFRIDFLAQVVMDLCFYSVHIITFELLFGMGDGFTIAGWDRAAVRVFLGFLFVADAFMMTWLSQGWFLPQDIKNGNLDPVRLRPAPSILVYFFQRFSPEGAVNFLCAFSYLGYGLTTCGPLSADIIWTLPLALFLCIWAEVVVAVGLGALEFLFVNSDLSRFFIEMAQTASGKPLDIYKRRVRQFLILVLPVGVLAHVPAEIVLGRCHGLELLGQVTWQILLGLAVFALFRRSFKRYESALS
ncbi:MAG: hypothetical protein CMJ87_03710 [Planctomycetes bacterium]|nr:hypothetical protein [Planctomycetota bacterium]